MASASDAHHSLFVALFFVFFFICAAGLFRICHCGGFLNGLDGEDGKEITFDELREMQERRKNRRKQWGRGKAKIAIKGRSPGKSVALEKALFRKKFDKKYEKLAQRAPEVTINIDKDLDDERGREIYGDSWFEPSNGSAIPLRSLFAARDEEIADARQRALHALLDKP